MDLIELFQTLFRRKWLILITTIIAAGIAAVGSLLITPTYISTALIRVSAAPNPLTERADVQYAQQLMNTYIILAKTRPILDKVIERLQLDTFSRRLSDQIDINAIGDTELIEITVDDSDPERATLIANTLADELILQTAILGRTTTASDAIQEQISQIEQEISDMRTEYDDLLLNSPGETARITELSRQLSIKQQTYETLFSQYEETRLSEAIRVNSITLVEEAAVPGSSSYPRKTLNVALGAVLGFLTGAGLALVLSNLDTRVYSTTQVKHLIQQPILAELTKASPSRVKFNDMTAAGRESYRRLRANLFSLEHTRDLKIFMVSSAKDGEGKSTVTYNLALSIAQLGQNVLVVDCDMRVPSQHKLFEVANTVGLSTVLERKISLSEAIQDTGIRNVHVLPSGPIPADPTQLLSLPYMKDMLGETASRFDIVLLDTPAILPVIDMALVAPSADGVLLLIRRGKTLRQEIQSAQSQIEEVQGRILGVVVNDTDVKRSMYLTN